MKKGWYTSQRCCTFVHCKKGYFLTFMGSVQSECLSGGTRFVEMHLFPSIVSLHVLQFCWGVFLHQWYARESQTRETICGCWISDCFGWETNIMFHWISNCVWSWFHEWGTTCSVIYLVFQRRRYINEGEHSRNKRSSAQDSCKCVVLRVFAFVVMILYLSVGPWCKETQAKNCKLFTSGYKGVLYL